MRILLDTQLLLWIAEGSGKVSPAASRFISDPLNETTFSVASIWEVAIKNSKGLPNFQVDPSLLRGSLLHNGFTEIAILGKHAIAVSTLPAIHKDPFDRLIIAQAIVEGITLLTADKLIARYPGPIHKV